MPAYNFQKQFVHKIMNGEKRCTIRAARKGGGNPAPGKRLQLYWGMRTKSCTLILATQCKAVRPIIIDVKGDDYLVPHVWIDGDRLHAVQVEALARLDGFKDAAHFGAFFKEKYPLPANLWLIEW